MKLKFKDQREWQTDLYMYNDWSRQHSPSADGARLTWVNVGGRNIELLRRGETSNVSWLIVAEARASNLLNIVQERRVNFNHGVNLKLKNLATLWTTIVLLSTVNCSFSSDDTNAKWKTTYDCVFYMYFKEMIQCICL